MTEHYSNINLLRKLRNGLKNNRKTCAIVGNARSLFLEKLGPQIDKYRLVVRINEPRILKPDYQGTKKDFLFITHRSLERIKQKKIQQYVEEYALVLNVSTDLLDIYLKWKDIMEKEMDIEKARPTAGFIAIMYMVEKGYDVRLFGFDFYETGTYYRKSTKPFKRHYPQWEKSKLQEMGIIQ